MDRHLGLIEMTEYHDLKFVTSDWAGTKAYCYNNVGCLWSYQLPKAEVAFGEDPAVVWLRVGFEVGKDWADHHRNCRVRCGRKDVEVTTSEPAVKYTMEEDGLRGVITHPVQGEMTVKVIPQSNGWVTLDDARHLAALLRAAERAKEHLHGVPQVRDALIDALAPYEEEVHG